MGYGYYSLDVAREARSSNSNAFNYAGYGLDGQSSEQGVHQLLDIKGKIRECLNTTPVVVALDVTRSRGNDSKVVYEKLPTFLGQMEIQGYIEGPAISFCAIGDATSGDKAPLQVGQFEADNRLDEVLSNFWIEEGGGGSGQESYELAAYYYANFTKLEANNQGRKGYFFFVGDEGFYPKVDKNQIKNILGQDVPDSIDSVEAFNKLKEKFHVFFIYPTKTFEQRKADIDAEIQQRVEAAGGQYKNVDVRASLIWNNRNDLDLHVICPSGEEIFYGHKISECKGWLDVDMNVQGETVKPVENIRWKMGEAPKGRYKVFVQNYRFHDAKQGPNDFKVEVEVAGEIKHFTGTVSPHGETGGLSNVTVHEFDFDPARPRANQAEIDTANSDVYKNYADDKIKNQWTQVIGQENLLLIDNPATIIDVMLGAISLVSGSRDLDGYMSDMKNREPSPVLLENTRQALLGLSGTTAAVARVNLGTANVPASDGTKRKTNTQRL